MTAKIILCSGCGTKNRIPEVKPKGKATCGNCGKLIGIKGKKGSFLSSLLRVFLSLWFVWAITLFVVFVPYLDNSKNKASRNSNSHQQLEKKTFRKIDPNENIILDLTPIPITKGIISKNYASGVAPLKIETNYGNDYYIKVVNIANNQEALTAYIAGGEDFEIMMPLGTYEIRYAAGKIWYGTQYYFGPNTTYKADELFKFTFDGNQYTGYTVELILQTHGNLSTSYIDPSEF